MRFARAAAMNDDEQLQQNEAAVRGGFWHAIGRIAAQIPFAEDVLTAYYCAFDRGTPTYVRLALLGALAYFIDPFDLMPDMLPIIGLTDDAAVIGAATKLVFDQIKPEHRDVARGALKRMNDAPAA